MIQARLNADPVSYSLVGSRSIAHKVSLLKEKFSF